MPIAEMKMMQQQQKKKKRNDIMRYRWLEESFASTNNNPTLQEAES